MPEFYRIKDIRKRIDRNKTTLLRWEELGLIPMARKDSRGWRYYTAEEVKIVIKIVIDNDYFRNGKNGNSNGVNNINNSDHDSTDGEEWRI